MTTMTKDECRGHWHTHACKQATDLAEYPHEMVKVDTLGPNLDWIETEECCSRCYAWMPRQLAEGCRSHSARPPTLSFSYPTCSGCLEEVTHDGDSFSCENCKVHWSDNPTEDEYGQRWDDDSPTVHACAAPSEPSGASTDE